MDQFEKVDKLATRAGVTFAVAREALEKTNWDMLDAMIMLEQQGNAEAPARSDYSTCYEDQPGYSPVNETRKMRRERLRAVREAESEERKARRCESRKRFREKLKNFFKMISANRLVMKHEDKLFINIPLWLFLLIMLVFFKFTCIFVLVTLILGCRYSLRGPAGMESANNVLDAVGNAVGTVVDKVDDVCREFISRAGSRDKAASGKKNSDEDKAEGSSEASSSAEGISEANSEQQ